MDVNSGGWIEFESAHKLLMNLNLNSTFADPSMSAQAGVGILTSPRLSDCVSDWIPLGSRVCMLKLKVLDRSLCLLQVYAPNATSEYQTFVEEVLKLSSRGFGDVAVHTRFNRN